MIGISAISCLFFFAFSDGPSFQGVGFNDPSHNESECYAVSPDGSHAIGISQLDPGIAPMEGATIWYPNGSFDVMEGPGISSRSSFPNAITPAQQVVGTYFSAEAFAFSWRPGEVSTTLSLGGAMAISEDGSIICGAETALVDGFHILAAWRIVNGTQSYLGGYPQSWSENRTAKAMTPDGTYIAGVESDLVFQIQWRPYIWSEETGFEYLASLPDWRDTRIDDLSQDGTKAVGTVYNGTDWEAGIWERGQTAIGLGDFPGGEFHSGATAISPGGNLVVGFGTGATGRQAFIWHDTFGMQPLQPLIETTFGLDLSGWTLRTVHGFSRDASVLVGTGINPDGKREGFILRLGAVVLGLSFHLQDWDSGQVTITELMEFL